MYEYIQICNYNVKFIAVFGSRYIQQKQNFNMLLKLKDIMRTYYINCNNNK